MKNITILGSTGSIGTQTLDVIRMNPEQYNVIAISGNNNIELLAKQAGEFYPKYIALYNEEKLGDLKNLISNKDIKIVCGLEGLCEIASLPEVDVVVTSVVGNVGLLPTVSAIKAGKDIALANKETLVTAGEIIMPMAEQYGVNIIPVDSEHSAIYQCIQGNEPESVRRLILTASGGPFRTLDKAKLESVRLEQALKHPNWSMGSKITIDSATLMNKGLEVIEAKWLFNVPIDKVDVIVHPQSIVHSMVEFVDGSILAQMGLPDMKHPIHFALNYPKRGYIDKKSLDITKMSNLTFEEPRRDAFPALDYAYEAVRKGGTYPTALNAANEELVSLFLQEKIAFLDIAKGSYDAMNNHNNISNPTIDDILLVDKNTRQYIYNNY